MLHRIRLLSTQVIDTMALFSSQRPNGASVQTSEKLEKCRDDGSPGGKRRVSGSEDRLVSSIHSNGTAITRASGSSTRCQPLGRVAVLTGRSPGRRPGSAAAAPG